MPGKCYSRMAAIAAFLHIFNPSSAWSQNNYPASGDALIHGLTIGTGNGAQLSNTALGDSALFYNKAGINNTAAGRAALFHNSSGQDNTALGYQALYANFSGGYNLAAGIGALLNNYSGSYNVALGESALGRNTTANYNTAVGPEALDSNTTGLGNTACGLYALYDNMSSSFNTAVGDMAMMGDSTDSYSTALGSETGLAFQNQSNATVLGIGQSVYASNSIRIGIWSGGSVGGYAGWTNFSDGRYKKNISRKIPGLTFINQLDPVTYTLDVDGIASRLHANKKLASPSMQEQSRIAHSGFIAQDVERTVRSLNCNFSGVDRPKDDQQSFYGLRYSDFVVPLVKAIQELSAENDSLKAANARISSQLDQIEWLLGIGPKPTLHK
jgi:hypothetical protein